MRKRKFINNDKIKRNPVKVTPMTRTISDSGDFKALSQSELSIDRALHLLFITILCMNCVRYDGMAGFLSNVCVLLSSCSARDTSCSSCHSAPVPCSQQIQTTTTSTTTITTTTTTSAPTKG